MYNYMTENSRWYTEYSQSSMKDVVYLFMCVDFTYNMWLEDILITFVGWKSTY